MEHSEDIVIVGAGPAGAYCALELSKQGKRPVIFDHSHPREKPCGGGISPPVLKKFPFLERFRSQGLTFGSFRIISCTNFQVITNSFKDGFCISRKFLDKGILNLAIQNGAKLIKEKVIEVQKKGRYWKVKTNIRQVKTKILVGADGVNSIVRRKTIGKISSENLALTFGYCVSKIKKEDATIKFLSEIPGYIWIFPGRNYSKIGIGGEIKYGGKILKRILDEFINTYCPQIKVISSYAAMLPSANNLKFFKSACAGDDWILIGDAAGHVDPISGGGILYALWGGVLAAQAIKDNDPLSFDKKWRKEYAKSLVENCKNKLSFYDPLDSNISLAYGLAKNKFLWPMK
jgi:digeranylgeranylglycerophospholipid reductase